MSCTSLILQIFLLSLFSWYVFRFKRRRFHELAAKFRGPEGYPFVGNALQCLLPPTEIPRVILEASGIYRSQIKLWFGSHLVIFVWKPQDVEKVLNSSHVLGKHPHVIKLMEMIVGPGLPSLKVDEWKRHRKLVSPNFSQNRVENSFDMFFLNTKKLIEDMRIEEGNGNFDASAYLDVCVLNSILESMLLGIKIEKTLYDIEEIRSCFKEILAGVVYRATNFVNLSDFIFDTSRTGRKSARARKRLTNIINSIINHWKRNLGEKLESSESTGPKTFLDHHFSSSGNETDSLSDVELRNEIQAAILAGFGTSSTMMGYLLVVLGMHPDIQNRVFDEISQLLDAESDLRYSDLKRFAYTERVIKETLRIFPVLPAFSRYTKSEVKLDNGKIIPAECTVAIGLLSLHRDPEIWPEPTRFDPERFLPQEEAKRHPCSWIPFSNGPRRCLGFQYALMALKTLAIGVIQNYKIETEYKNVDDVRLAAFVLLRPIRGFSIRIVSRNVKN